MTSPPRQIQFFSLTLSPKVKYLGLILDSKLNRKARHAKQLEMLTALIEQKDPDEVSDLLSLAESILQSSHSTFGFAFWWSAL